VFDVQEEAGRQARVCQIHVNLQCSDRGKLMDHRTFAIAVFGPIASEVAEILSTGSDCIRSAASGSPQSVVSTVLMPRRAYSDRSKIVQKLSRSSFTNSA
jgi:hypothetical protein